MGEVFRARDTELDRDVAIKVLPQALADDPDRLARFEREARLAYVSDESGQPEVYIRAYPGLGAKRKVSNLGGTEPVWARDGREIY